MVGAIEPLLTLADLAALVVEADVDEACATQVAPGLAAGDAVIGDAAGLGQGDAVGSLGDGG